MPRSALDDILFTDLSAEQAMAVGQALISSVRLLAPRSYGSHTAFAPGSIDSSSADSGSNSGTIGNGGINSWMATEHSRQTMMQFSITNSNHSALDKLGTSYAEDTDLPDVSPDSLHIHLKYAMLSELLVSYKESLNNIDTVVPPTNDTYAHYLTPADYFNMVRKVV